MSEEIGYAMHKDYMRVLFDLQRELARELDRAQLGQVPGPDFAYAMAAVAGEAKRVLQSMRP